MGLILTALIGLAAGTIAKRLKPGDLFEPNGYVKTALLGVGGAFVGNIILRAIGFNTSGLIGELIAAVIGALALLYGYQWYKTRNPTNSN